MANHEIGVPDCFSYHMLEDPMCESCPLLESCSQIMVAEEVAGGVPDLVFRLDREIVTDKDFERLRHERPNIYRWYMKFNGVSSE